MANEHLISKLNEALGWELRAINMYALLSLVVVSDMTWVLKGVAMGGVFGPACVEVVLGCQELVVRTDLLDEAGAVAL